MEKDMGSEGSKKGVVVKGRKDGAWAGGSG